jgi:hypothetical protein
MKAGFRKLPRPLKPMQDDLLAPMSAQEFERSLWALEWDNYIAAARLGVSDRNIRRYLSAALPVPTAIRHLVRLLIEKQQWRSEPADEEEPLASDKPRRGRPPLQRKAPK